MNHVYDVTLKPKASLWFAILLPSHEDNRSYSFICHKLTEIKELKWNHKYHVREYNKEINLLVSEKSVA